MKSYLRFLGRNKLYTAIMAVGLSVSLAFVIIMSCFVWQNLSVNSYYPDQDRMYAVGTEGSVMSNTLMAQVMTDAIPEVESGTTVLRLSYNPGNIDGVSLERRSYMAVQKGFFDFFPTRFIYGNEDLLNDSNNVLVTESLAAGFGGEKIIGKIYIHDEGQEFIVAGIIEDFDGSIFANEQIVLNSAHPSQSNWFSSGIGVSSSGVISVVKVKEGTDETDLLAKMNGIYEKEAGISENWKTGNYLSLTRLDKVYMSDNNDGEYSGFKKGNPGLMTAFSIIAIFLLISAVLNYINLSTALAGRRSNETATRELLGESKPKILVRHLLESLGFMAVCMCAAFLIARLCLPYINMLIESPVPISIRFDQGYIYMYIIILGITALLCGIIPATMVFRFNAIDILKGHFHHQSKRAFGKVFVIIQGAIAIVIIAASLTMDAQIRHMISMPLNANSEGIYICKTFSAGFDKTLAELPFVEEYGRAQGRPGSAYGSYGFELNNEANKDITLDICECDSASFALFGFRVVKDFGLPGGEGAWLTESAFRKLEMDPDNPVFPEKNRWAINFVEVAGIIEDVPMSPALNLEPEASAVIIKGPQDPVWSEYVVKLSDPSEHNIRELDRLCDEEIRKTFGSAMPAMSGYMPDLLENSYEGVRKQANLVTLFMIIAIMLSALGQIAMSTYYATEREKEISIRKVFGGTVRSESIRNISAYMGYCLIAVIAAVPVAVWISGRYIETFVYRMNLKPWIFIVASLAIFATSLASVLWQTLRAARTNPAEALKKE